MLWMVFATIILSIVLLFRRWSRPKKVLLRALPFLVLALFLFSGCKQKPGSKKQNPTEPDAGVVDPHSFACLAGKIREEPSPVMSRRLTCPIERAVSLAWS